MLSAILAAAAVASAPGALVCDFRAVHTADLTPRYKPTPASDHLLVTYAALNAEAGTAQMVGNAGSPKVIFVAGTNQFDFIERTPFGNMTLTSVFGAGGEGEQMAAVHSRHIEVAPGDVVISQYVGVCTARR